MFSLQLSVLLAACSLCGHSNISIFVSFLGFNNSPKKNPKQECLSALCHASFVDVYLAYLKSYGHLKIIKCIGMY